MPCQSHSHDGKEPTYPTTGAAKLQCCVDYRCQMYFHPKMGFSKCMDAYCMLRSISITCLRRQKEEPQLPQEKAETVTRLHPTASDTAFEERKQPV